LQVLLETGAAVFARTNRNDLREEAGLALARLESARVYVNEQLKLVAARFGGSIPDVGSDWTFRGIQ
jgi:hypothetical protein